MKKPDWIVFGDNDTDMTDRHNSLQLKKSQRKDGWQNQKKYIRSAGVG